MDSKVIRDIIGQDIKPVIESDIKPEQRKIKIVVKTKRIVAQKPSVFVKCIFCNYVMDISCKFCPHCSMPPV